MRFDARGRLPAGDVLVHAALEWVREVELVGRGLYRAPLEAYFTAVEEEEEDDGPAALAPLPCAPGRPWGRWRRFTEAPPATAGRPSPSPAVAEILQNLSGLLAALESSTSARWPMLADRVSRASILGASRRLPGRARRSARRRGSESGGGSPRPPMSPPGKEIRTR